MRPMLPAHATLERERWNVRPRRYPGAMSKREKLLDKLKNNPRAARFEDLQRALKNSGFVLARIGGSHFIYRHKNGRMCNIQRASDGGAKSYQIEQVLEAIDAAR
jgi:predicted RNA binding protein YcfA (HicA-like mRNA interferase family)